MDDDRASPDAARTVPDVDVGLASDPFPAGDSGVLARPSRPWQRPVPGWVAPTGTLARRVWENLHDPLVLLGLVLIFAFVTRMLWLEQPGKGLIFDEAYYVNASRVILGQPVAEGAHYWDQPAYLDPNQEHPPLGKLLIAASMTVFGDNGVGWRIPSVIAGMLALVALFFVVRAAGGSSWLALLAVGLLALDNLSLVHGRIGVLDMMALAPALIASWLALRRRWALAAIAMAIGLLVKLTAMYAIGAIVLLYLLQVAPAWWAARRIRLRDLVDPIAFVLLTVVLFVGGLTALDAKWSSYKNPFDHISHMLTYGANLAQPVGSVGICPRADSRPWDWLFNDCQIQYLRTDVTVKSGDQVVSRVARIDFRGAMNPLLTAALPIAFLFTAWYALRRRNGPALWALTWAAANWLPYLLLALASQRIMYLYYFLPTIPAVAVAIAVLLLRSNLPRFVMYGFVALYIVGFLAYFPFRQIP